MLCGKKKGNLGTPRALLRWIMRRSLQLSGSIGGDRQPGRHPLGRGRERLQDWKPVPCPTRVTVLDTLIANMSNDVGQRCSKLPLQHSS
jgi:hypothetical protein